jgi:DNA-binding transcriptional MerR regulator
MKLKPIQKLYYSISEVSKLTALKQYVLRYWETEFPELNPAKNRAGNRIYQLTDIKIIFLIKKLLYEEKYTIDGARKQLKQLHDDKDDQLPLPLENQSREDILNEIKNDLVELINLLTDKKKT